MKRAVWKYEIPRPDADGWTKVDLPLGAKMLQAGTQDAMRWVEENASLAAVPPNKETRP